MDKSEIISLLVEKFKLKPQVFETGRNSIQLEWENEKGYLELEVYDDKIEILVMDSNNGVIFES